MLLKMEMELLGSQAGISCIILSITVQGVALTNAMFRGLSYAEKSSFLFTSRVCSLPGGV